MSREKQTPAPIRSSAAEVLTYVASTGDPQGSIEIRYEDENIWLTQKMMAQLYDVVSKRSIITSRKSSMIPSCQRIQLSENFG